MRALVCCGVDLVIAFRKRAKHNKLYRELPIKRDSRIVVIYIYCRSHSLPLLLALARHCIRGEEDV